MKNILRRIILRLLSKKYFFNKTFEILQLKVPNQIIFLEYPVYSVPRYNKENPHSAIFRKLNESSIVFFENLKFFETLNSRLKKIPYNSNESLSPIDPTWENIWFSGLDLITLYGFVCKYKPKKYLEVGSGNSTKIAFKAIKDHGLKTRVISIDPNPRAEINDICDEVIRQPLEQVDLEIFKTLEAGDILFIDNSHRLFMNSDVQVVFLDIIPYLQKGVLIHIHDIFLPYDYPKSWVDRYYSEQYMLVPFILYGGEKFEILMANHFLSNNSKAMEIVDRIYKNESKSFKAPYNSSFWMVTE